jgi:signal transduction histidine kinase
MRRLFDLSLRHKIPLWGASLIVVAIAAVAVALMGRVHDDMKGALVISADNLGRTLATTLAPTLLHDDVWRAFEIVRSPIRVGEAATTVQAGAAVVLNRDGQVFVSSDPDGLPMLADARALGRDWRELAARIDAARADPGAVVHEPSGSAFLYVALPITDNDAWLGHLVLRYDRSVFYPWFRDTALRGLLIGLIVLAVLIPINWYWGSRMAKPLVALSARMGRMPETLPERIERGLYPYRDELGQLFLAYNRMVEALREKAVLEGEMVQSERLAAIGRLTAGIAHEINNPLAGLVTAVDTLKQRRDRTPACSATWTSSSAV